jgi:plastocyanin
MRRAESSRIFHLALLCACIVLAAEQANAHAAEVTAHLVTLTGEAKKAPPAVIWLKPVAPSAAYSVAPGNYTLLQKNRMFTPHLLVVPVGSSVAFPNADPFFHNVFSLFDGKRFDLGLYEAGSTRSVVFSREGVSYIFCNIHSDMSAVVIAVSTPYYASADSRGEFQLKDVPDGEYDLHVWIEGRHQNLLNQMIRRVHITGEVTNLGEIHAGRPEPLQHLNKFGRPYGTDIDPIY